MMIKKMLTSALCLMLALCLCAPALAAEVVIVGNAGFFGINTETGSYDNNVSDIANVGDTLYILLNDRIERWTPGMEQPELFIDSLVSNRYGDEEKATDEKPLNISTLFADDEQLYGLAIATGDVYLLADKEGKPSDQKLVTLDIADLHYKGTDYQNYAGVYSMFFENGLLYSLILHDDGMMGGFKVIGFDMSTGERKTSIDVENAIGLAPYKDGKLLLHTDNAAGAYDEENETMRPSQLYALNPESGESALIRDVPEGMSESMTAMNVIYRPETDDFVYISGSAIYTMPSDAKGAERISAYLPNNVWRGPGNKAVLLSSGIIAQCSYEGLNIRTLDAPGVEKGALIVAGEYGSDQHAAAVAAHPEINVALSSTWMNDLESITGSMLSDEGSIDVIRLDASYSPIDKLIEKGYALCLSDYPEIAAITDRMDERLIAPYKRDGKLYAAPTGIYSNSMGYHPEVLETLGLTVDDLPKTYPEFFDFVANYMYDYGEDYPDINLFDDFNVMQSLLNRYQTDYISWQLSTKGELAFDTQVYRDALKAIADIDYTEFDPFAQYGEDVWSDNETMDEYWSKKSLFTMYTNATNPGMYRDEHATLPLLLALEEGEQPLITVTSELIMINPKSTRLSEAAAYVSAYLGAIDETMALALFPDVTEPIVNKRYETDRAELERYYAEREKALEAAEEENKAEIREQIESLKKELDGYEKYKYNVSADMLARFRSEICPYLTPAKQTPITDYSGKDGNQFWSLGEQYRSGAIDLDKYVREMDNRIRMMTLEDQ